jgi:hypothetical protein
LTDTTFYAVYKAENVYKVPTNSKYFKIENSTISLNPDYVKVLSGKITLPALDSKKQKITSVGNMYAPYVTHVFFEEGSEYIAIERSAF